MHASIACLLLYEDYVRASQGNAKKAKQSKAVTVTHLKCHGDVLVRPEVEGDDTGVGDAFQERQRGVARVEPHLTHVLDARG